MLKSRRSADPQRALTCDVPQHKLVRVFSLAVGTVVFLSICVAPASAQIFTDYVWENPSGGSYNNVANWSPVGIPDSDSEGALFNLGANYQVTFPMDVTTNSAIVRDGTILFDLGSSGTPRTYTLSSLNIDPTIDGTTFVVVQDGTVKTTTLRVADGGILANSIGGLIDVADGTATVTGPSALWAIEFGFHRVGQNGTGTLTVSEGGKVQSENGSAIGRFPNSNGTVTVTGDGSRFEVDANLTVGQVGMGTLLVEDGGTVESAFGRVAFDGDATGTVTVTGTGSTWTSSNQLRVGEGGEGTLTIEAGGNVTSETMVVTEPAGSIGVLNGSMGSVIVTGEGSTWTNNGVLRIGDQSASDGSLMIADGGHVFKSNDAAGSVFLGYSDGAEGSAIVNGDGSSWAITDGGLVVGREGRGTLSIETGGNLTTEFRSDIGFATDSFGLATVTGADSTWTNDSTLFVGTSGRGTLHIFNGSSVSNTNGFIGSDSGSIGVVLIQDAGSSWSIDGRLSIGGNVFGNGNGGRGTLQIMTGSTVNVEQDTILYENGEVLLQGGTLATTRVDLQGGQFLWSSGTLHVDVFDGDLINPNGGTLAPGRSAGGTTIFGDYTQQTGATLQIEVGGRATATLYDFVDVHGLALLGGSLELALLDDFRPEPDDKFIVLNADDLAGFFNNAGNGQRLDTIDGLGSFLVHYGPTSPFDANQIVLSEFISYGLAGDYNQNGIVDAADYTVWRDNLGSPTALANDDTAGVGPDDYTRWKNNFGMTLGSGSLLGTAVPEPAQWTQVLFALLLIASCRRPEWSLR